MNLSFTRAGRFWIATITSFVSLGLLFGWLLGLLNPIGLAGPPRIEPANIELVTAAFITILFSVSVGLIVWRRKYGSCPTGAKRTTGAAGTLGTAALFCPICTILPIGIAGFSVSLGFLLPYLPLLRIIVLLMLSMNIIALMPRKQTADEVVPVQQNYI